MVKEYFRCQNSHGQIFNWLGYVVTTIVSFFGMVKQLNSLFRWGQAVEIPWPQSYL